jgi:hypothetical protein
MRSAMENIIIVRFDILQDSLVQLSRGGYGEAPIRIKQSYSRHSLGIQFTVALNLETHQSAPAVIHNPSRQVIRG